ncbi:hypothetical protein KBD87_04720 [Candidatus Saccharibacteria bacterium]|jgi:cytoskeletal protein RodZ|nr:hypothetical protein [Candidatus Saccharibacteria bacterium]
MRERTKHQGGSLLGYVTVAILLAGLLVGGLYWVQRYNKTSKNGTTVAVATHKDTAKNTTPVTDEKTADNRDTSNGSTTTDTPAVSKSDDKKATSPSTPAPSTTSTEDDESNDGQVGTSPAVEALPATGPTAVGVQGLALGLLAFSVAAYVKSRRLDF